MKKKFAKGMFFLCLLSLLCMVGRPVIDAKPANPFSGEVSLLKEEEDSCVLEVKVANQGEDFEGVVRLLFTGNDSDSNCAYDMQMTLPSAGEKQYTITVPKSNIIQTRGKGILAFMDQKEKVLQTVPFKDLFQGKTSGFQVGVLSDHFDRVTYMDLGGETYYLRNSEKPISLVEIKPEELETQLDGLYYLIIDQFDLSTLEQKKIEAIESWVDNGGALILGTGEYADKILGSFDSGFVELTLGKVSKPGEDNKAALAMTNMDSYYLFKESGIDFAKVAVAELDDPGFRYYETDCFPGWICSRGNGCVTVLSFSLGEDELQKASADACRTIYDETSSNASGMMGYSSWEDWGYLGRNAFGVIDHQNTSVDFTWPDIMIVLYVILVGPILYLILRKCKKSEWYWLGVPVLAFVFIGAIFLYGQSMKVHDTRVYSVSVQCADGKDQGTLDTYYCAYHSGVKEWSLKLADCYTYGGAGLCGYGMSTGQSTPDDYHYRFCYGEDMTMGMKPESNFETGYLYASGTAQNSGQITVKDVILTNQTNSGSIENQTEYDFPYMFLMSDNYFMAIKDVKAGERVNLAQAKKQNRIVYEGEAQYMDDVYYNILDVYGNLQTNEEQYDLLAALFIGSCTAKQKCEWGAGQIVVSGVVADYDRTVDSKCVESSYGCLYTIAEQEASNAAD